MNEHPIAVIATTYALGKRFASDLELRNFEIFTNDKNTVDRMKGRRFRGYLATPEYDAAAERARAEMLRAKSVASANTMPTPSRLDYA